MEDGFGTGGILEYAVTAPQTPRIMDQLILADYRANQCTVATFDRELAKADGASLVGAHP
jgi:predicted nucleic acid-binding protein